MASATTGMSVRRTNLLRFAILLIALAQLGTSLAPHTGSFTGADPAHPHWHAAGDTLELSHDDTACPTCSLQQMSRAPGHTVQLPIAAITTVHVAPATERSLPPATTFLIYSRGPPLS